jgi:20S proteasome subunit alpha 7
LEKLALPDISVKEAIKHAARIIYFAHDDNSKDKDFELEMTWVRLEKGATDEGVPVKGWGKHEEVPKELVAEAERLAKESMEGGDEEMEE